jgi:hypothetical protein
VATRATNEVVRVQPEIIRGSFRPGDQIVHEFRTPWVFVRQIKHPDGLYVGIEATEARAERLQDGSTLITIPGCCVGVTRAELGAVIGALIAIRERLPEGG